MVRPADRSRDAPLWSRLGAAPALLVHAAADPCDAAFLARSVALKSLAVQMLMMSVLAAAAFGALASAAEWAPAWRGALAGAVFGIWWPAVHHAIRVGRGDRAATAALRGGLGYWLGFSLSILLLLSPPLLVALSASIPAGVGGAIGAYFISKNESAFAEAQQHAVSTRDNP